MELVLHALADAKPELHELTHIHAPDLERASGVVARVATEHGLPGDIVVLEVAVELGSSHLRTWHPRHQWRP